MSITVPSKTPEATKDLWGTPPDVYGRLDATYGPFDLDLAASPENAKHRLWLGPGSPLGIEDCLGVYWDWLYLKTMSGNPALLGTPRLLRGFLNPVYSSPYPFVAKAHAEARAGRCLTVLLLAASTGVRWWHEFVYDAGRGRYRPGVEVEFLGRVRHLRPDGTVGDSPNFASVVIVFYGGL